jgi:hypothetical protein
METLKKFWNSGKLAKGITIFVVLIILGFINSLFEPAAETPPVNADAISTEAAQTITAEYQQEEPTDEPEAAAITPESLVEKYGGKAEVYAEIMASEDCASLQETFDRAADNNETAEAGSPEASWTLGYMTVSDERMQELGCYD